MTNGRRWGVITIRLSYCCPTTCKKSFMFHSSLIIKKNISKQARLFRVFFMKTNYAYMLSCYAFVLIELLNKKIMVQIANFYTHN